MKMLLRLGRFSLLVFSISLCAGEPAQVRLYCQSLRFLPATTELAGQTYTFELTTATNSTEINNELAPLFDPRFRTHSAHFQMQDPAFPEPIRGEFAFDIPLTEDANENGFEDFFESSQGVAARTEGAFITSVDQGKVTATWSRAPGATTGTCRLQLTGDQFGQLPEFTHTFELLEYTGQLVYAPGSNAITGSLELAQTSSLSNTLTGALTFTRVATNRFDWVDLLPGNLVDQTGQPLSYGPAALDRDQLVKTNYYGSFVFRDGDLSTGVEDFRFWVLSIDDPNDSNGNGIPDFSDDPGSGNSSRPRLALARSANELLLSISAETGQSFDLEEIELLGEPSGWTRIGSVTITNDPQTVTVPLPDTATRFWRLRRP